MHNLARRLILPTAPPDTGCACFAQKTLLSAPLTVSLGWCRATAHARRLMVAGQIILFSGHLQCSAYAGSLEVRIDPHFLPGRSCLAAQTQPGPLDLAEKPGFQEGLLRLMKQAGLLAARAYKLIPARRHPLPCLHLFSGLRLRNTDVLEQFCLRHGAVGLRDSASSAALKARPEFSYHHKQVVNADNERVGRILAAGALPDSELWSQFELRQFKLESVTRRRHTFVVELVFSAANEDAARKLVANLFGPPLKANTVVVTPYAATR
jgi:hypothetical protein